MLPRERRNGGLVASRVAATAFGLGRFGGGFVTVPGGQHRCLPIPLARNLLLQCCPHTWAAPVGNWELRKPTALTTAFGWT